MYLQLLCMAVKQERNGRLMLYGNIPVSNGERRELPMLAASCFQQKGGLFIEGIQVEMRFEK